MSINNDMNDIMIRPKCKCHDIEMFWHKNLTLKNGGTWQCIVKKRESDKKYCLSENKKISNKKYRQSGKGRIADKRYRETPNGFLKHYITQRDKQIKMLRSKAILELEDIRKQRKELETCLQKMK